MATRNRFQVGQRGRGQEGESRQSPYARCLTRCFHARAQYDSSLLSPLFAEDGQAPVQRYRAVRPSASSVVFSPTGQYFAVTFPHFLPTLYTPSSNTPLACFSSPETAANIKSGEPFSGYRNTTTTKHGSFYGDDVPGGGKLWFAAGSDDFKAYVWEVPPRQLLEDGRRVPGLGQDEWKMADGRPSIGECARGVVLFALLTP